MSRLTLSEYGFRDNIVWRNMAFSQTNTRPVKLLSPPKTLVVIKKNPWGSCTSN